MLAQARQQIKDRGFADVGLTSKGHRQGYLTGQDLGATVL
jgi:hypothetical protein